MPHLYCLICFWSKSLCFKVYKLADMANGGAFSKGPFYNSCNFSGYF